ncbi:MAG: hypothetical protein IPG59_06155 [Candidatus Melainabacteria bacterium]|nr:MAG: hypothetical protein IPG59_06155 [Candidatus Melainabacteria bacterium]
MTKAVEQIYIKRLEKSGLFVSEPYPVSHVLSQGVMIGKPTSVSGNNIKDYNFGYDDIPMDAPAVILFSTDKQWIVLGQEASPLPGPGDFMNFWDTIDEAIDDILDFYFGDSSRMQAKEQARLEVRSRIAQFKKDQN